jgi:preprotein translocase subunit SecG
MKIYLVGIFIVVGLVLSACSTKKDNFYDRSNSASEKSLNGLERDTK